tara:strand:+ start:236 stop:649 length:414 start_codon:yes stop_codon:yes gene_type:complete
MYETQLKTNNKSNSFFNLFIIFLIILIVFYNKKNLLYEANSDLVEVSKTPADIKYIKEDSLIYKKKGVIELKTKYLNIDPENSSKIEENIYVMKINCITNKYKDISVNGKKNISSKWEDPKRDKLINDVISYGCKNV